MRDMGASTRSSGVHGDDDGQHAQDHCDTFICLSVFEPYTMGYQAGCDHVVDLSELEREGRSQSTGAAVQPG
ncbi:hypothetical protein OG470_20255 [Micromonospora sp. NBC_00389]|uniref:hypothetical protein n=1 Tax=Micromonospora sp. NBC_00389 TaxID=2903586 RepID=UPI002E1D2843